VKLTNILHSEVDAVRIVIPEDVNVLSVSGEGVGEWQETEQQGERVLLIPFTYGKKGNITVRVTTESSLSETGVAKPFSGLRTLNTVRENGFIGIALNTSAEVTVTESEGLEKVAVQKLPRPLINMSVKPLILGFKYLKHPYSIVLDIKKHEKVGVPIATVNSASIVTLFTEDGKVVCRLVYQIRNSAKQFMELLLPEKADVWSVFVGNQPVESSINAEGKLLVPLIRSSSVNNQLNTFPVEVIYCIVNDRFSLFGTQKSMLPSVDLLISQLMWSVYLPNDYSYVYFTSTLEKEDIIRGVNVFTGARRRYNEKAMKEIVGGDYKRRESRVQMKKAYKGKDYKSNFRNTPMQEEQITSQVDAELEFSGRLDELAKQEEPQASISRAQTGTGILPIQIQVPTGGQVYRFARTIIKTEDPLKFSVIYTRLWVITAFKWFIFLIVILILYLKRKTLGKAWRWLSEKLSTFNKFYEKHEKTITKYTQSPVTPVLLFGLMIVFWTVSRLLGVLFLFLFFLSLFYNFTNYLKKRSLKKIVSKKKTEEKDAAKEDNDAAK
jgi:Na+-transporting methylmalonyl-CoA/oxaloacetate decarboxylase gamma subunit